MIFVFRCGNNCSCQCACICITNLSEKIMVRERPFLRTVFQIWTMFRFGWVGGFRKSDRSEFEQKEQRYALIWKKNEEKNVLCCFKWLLLIVSIGLDRLIDNPCHLYSVYYSTYSIWIDHHSKVYRYFFSLLFQLRGGWVGQRQSEHCSD